MQLGLGQPPTQGSAGAAARLGLGEHLVEDLAHALVLGWRPRLLGVGGAAFDDLVEEPLEHGVYTGTAFERAEVDHPLRIVAIGEIEHVRQEVAIPTCSPALQTGR